LGHETLNAYLIEVHFAKLTGTYFGKITTPFEKKKVYLNFRNVWNCEAGILQIKKMSSFEVIIFSFFFSFVVPKQAQGFKCIFHHFAQNYTTMTRKA
jgi:hypothetical protein